MTNFPLIELSGTPQEIGFAHGKLLKGRIKKTLAFYKTIFKKEDKIILQQAAHFQKVIIKTFPQYAEEIEAIAEGAELDPLWIYALNARTEILSFGTQECTVAYFKEGAILGENWDWAESLESLAILFKIKRLDGHTILMMTEPGIIGKIGLNSAGIGVTLNLLECPAKLDGVPIHVLLRAILDCSSLSEAQSVILCAPDGKASNVLIADASGNSLDIEFAGKDLFMLNPQESIFVHTNHYLSTSFSKKENLASSHARYDRALALSKKLSGKKIAEMKQLLLDQENQELPICRPYLPSLYTTSIGTICSMIMDLRKKELQITKGSPLKHKFEKISL
ncbi:peptidase C45 [Candidatus Woesearchaeota archaeon]|nr:peptidase C45 [Candidatus Woesearchaeota archaeon]